MSSKRVDVTKKKWSDPPQSSSCCRRGQHQSIRLRPPPSLSIEVKQLEVNWCSFQEAISRIKKYIYIHILVSFYSKGHCGNMCSISFCIFKTFWHFSVACPLRSATVRENKNRANSVQELRCASNLVTPGHTWSHLIILCDTWSHIATPGHTWRHLVTPGDTWSRLSILCNEVQFPESFLANWATFFPQHADKF